MANWSNPQLTSTYTNFLAEVKDRDVDLALQFDGTTSTNIPTNAIRWDSSANRWKKWSGSVWGELTATYALTALTLTGSITFEGATDDAYETTLTVVDPTADRTITLPNVTGTVVTTGDSGSVTSTMIADGTIVNADVNASAAIAGSKISPDFGSQNTTTTGTSTAASFIPTGATVPSNGIYLPAANQIGIATNSTQWVRITSTGDVNIKGAGTAGSTQAVSFSGSAPINSMVLDASGNLGLGVTPSADTLGGKKFEIGFAGSAIQGYQAANLLMYNNGTYNGGWKYANSAGVAYYQQNGSQHIWQNAPSGTAGNPITFTQAMTLDASGNLGIGETNPTAKLYVTGLSTQGYFNFKGGSANGGYGAFMNNDGTIIGYLGNGGGGALSGGTSTDFVVRATNNLLFSKGNSETARIDSSGRLLVGTMSDSGGALLQVNGDRIRIATAKTPASATATGTTGEVCWDADYVYVCTATNT